MTIIILIIISHEAYIHMDTDKKDGSSGQVLYLFMEKTVEMLQYCINKGLFFLLLYMIKSATS